MVKKSIIFNKNGLKNLFFKKNKPVNGQNRSYFTNNSLTANTEMVNLQIVNTVRSIDVEFYLCFMLVFLL